MITFTILGEPVPKGSTKANCRWATSKEQAANQTRLPHGPDGKFIRARA